MLPFDGVQILMQKTDQVIASALNTNLFYSFWEDSVFPDIP